MSRSTQYVGLTRRATEYLASLENNNLQHLENKYSDKDLHFEKRTTHGMFDEEIPLNTWKRFDIRTGREVYIREVVQCTPWSSGPMIMTCLEIDYGNGDHWDEPGDGKFDGTSTTRCFQWVDDPTVENEVDQDTGRMWV